MSDVIPAKKKVAVLASTVCCFAAMSATLPAIAARHGFHVVYLVIPLVVIQIIAFTYLLLAMRDLKRTASN